MAPRVLCRLLSGPREIFLVRQAHNLLPHATSDPQFARRLANRFAGPYMAEVDQRLTRLDGRIDALQMSIDGLGNELGNTRTPSWSEKWRR
jgi:hypothetical protein